MSAASERPRVAVCLAGAVRSLQRTWPAINHNLVAPTDAGVFVAIANEMDKSAGAGSRSNQKSEHFEMDDVRALIGPPLRGGVIWGADQLTDTSLTSWAGVDAANASKVHYAWRYLLKRWACNRLVAEAPDGPYDIVVTMRPDIYILRPYLFTAHHNGHHRSFSLRVGKDSAVRFGEDELLMNAFTLGCINDWIAVSSLRASTTIEQLVHHVYSANAFMPCAGARLDGLEVVLASYLWRVGLPRRLHPLHVELERKAPLHRNDSHHLGGSEDNKNDSHYDELYESFRERRDRVWWNGAWGAYCHDEAYSQYGDGFVLEDHDGTKRAYSNTITLPGTNRSYNYKQDVPGVSSPFYPVHTNQTSKYLKCTAGDRIFPPCNDAVDLMRPLSSCTRARLGQRLNATGKGQPYPAVCNGPCAPLPNASYIRNGVVVAASIFASYHVEHMVSTT